MISDEKINNLAIFGGQPIFENRLHVGRPNIGDRDQLITRVNEALDRRWLSNDGPFVREFEEKIGEITGAKYNLAVCNASVALEILYKALDFKGEVIVPSFTFAATAHMLEWLGITPVFCDISPGTHNIDPNKVVELITPNTTGIVGVHIWGKPCDTQALEEIAAQYNLRLAFDAAHAFGCSHNGKMIGNFGAAEVFSFHATKYVNSLEGGAISTNDSDLAKTLAQFRNFGFSDYDQVDSLGVNGKMNEISAAMGITSLEYRNEITEKNYQNYSLYRKYLSSIPGISVVDYDPKEQNNYHYIVLEIDENITRLTRDEIYLILHHENILARRYFYPGCHKMEPYVSKYPEPRQDLSQTELAVNNVLQLPNGMALSNNDIEKTCDLLHDLIDDRDEICDRLRT